MTIEEKYKLNGYWSDLQKIQIQIAEHIWFKNQIVMDSFQRDCKPDLEGLTCAKLILMVQGVTFPAGITRRKLRDLTGMQMP